MNYLYDAVLRRLHGETGLDPTDEESPSWEVLATDSETELSLSQIESYQSIQASDARKELDVKRPTPSGIEAEAEALLPDKRVPAPPSPGFERLDRIMSADKR